MQTVTASDQQALRAFLPGTLIQRWHERPAQPPVWGHWLSGSLMLCDISGFTAMSESLAQLGKEGAELMAGVLNRFFDRMLETAHHWGGVPMKFGGDAILLFFSGHQQADRAAACALAMQSQMPAFRRLQVGGQTHRLRMRIGIHSGRFFSASVGQPEGALHYLLLGPDVNRTAGVEAAAQPGQVVATAETVALLGCRCRRAQSAGGLWRLAWIEPPDAPQRREGADCPVSGVLNRYLLPPLAAGQAPTFSGEHRRVTTLFVNLLGVSRLLQSRGDGPALAQVDAYLNMVLSSLERHGGFLAGSDVAQEGDKLIVLFGAPLSHEREEASALRTALDLQRLLAASDLALGHRIGIASGAVFAGEIGSARRREYTVIGDSVNLAARLMAAARPAEALISADTAQRAGAEFDLRHLRPLRVKGKSAPVPVYRVLGERPPAPAPEPEAASPVIGREAEMASLLSLSRRAARGRCRWAHISGEPGIGKSRLVAEAAARLRSQGWRQVAAFCQAHTSGTPFAAWIAPLRALFGIGAGDSPPAAWAKLKAAVVRLCPDLGAFAPLIGELLSLPVDDDEPLLRSLDARTRRQRLTATIVEVIHETARERPLLLLFEDAHWADGPSLELLAQLLGGAGSPLLVWLTSRPATLPAELSALKPTLSLHLRELPPGDARRLAASAGRLSDSDLEAIVAKAQGNPLFLQEMARSGPAARGALPETIGDVIMTRLDRLPPEEKTALRLASVIGPSFELSVLQSLLPGRLEPSRLDAAMAGLSRSGFARILTADPPTYAFSHVLTQEVAYETLPYAQRRQLHRAVAAHIESERAAQLEAACELLLHHYELAADPAKTVLYAAMSGDRAAAMFAEREAINYYQRCLAALERAPRGSDGDRSAVLERMGDCRRTAAHHRESAEAFGGALSYWRRARRRSRARLVPWPAAGSAREALLCCKVATAHERRSDYAEALRWLDEALAALPRRAAHVGSQVCAAKSVCLFRKGLYREAIQWGRRALELARRSGETADIAYAHNMLANAHMEQGALRQAIGHLRTAVRLYHQIGDFAGQASANNNLGTCYQDLGVLDAALYHYQVALQAKERIGDVVDAAIVRNNIGEVLLAQGELDQAVAQLQEVVSAHQAGADLAAVAGLAHVNISRCRLAQDDLGAAEVYLRRGTRILSRLGAQGLLTEARLQLAELRLAQGRPQQARNLARRALTQARALDARPMECRGLRLLASAVAALGDSGAARRHLQESIALARRIGAGQEQARSLVALARILLDAGAPRRPAARRALQQAASILSRMGAALDLEQTQRLLASIGA